MTFEKKRRVNICVLIRMDMLLLDSKDPEYIMRRFCVAGINFNNADSKIRSLFSLTPESHQSLLEEAKQKGFRSLFALSTCNRTELYGFCESDASLIELLLTHTKGSKPILDNLGFVKRGKNAFSHLFQVAAGLQSKITGDYEIASQLKDAIAHSRKSGLIGPVMDKTVNYALHASKAVKSFTKLSDGTVSVSYAAVQWAKRLDEIGNKSVLIIGAGSIGRSVARNVKQYLDPASVTIVNRTHETAQSISNEFGFSCRPYAEIIAESRKSDIIIVCTNAPAYILTTDFINGQKPVLILDLSVPSNVHPAVKYSRDVSLIDVDQVSEIMEKTIARRNEELPKAKLIIEDHLGKFYEWLNHYRYASVINEMKSKLSKLSSKFGYDTNAVITRRINKTVGELAVHLRYSNARGCQYIGAINRFLDNHDG